MVEKMLVKLKTVQKIAKKKYVLFSCCTLFEMLLNGNVYKANACVYMYEFEFHQHGGN